MHTGRFGGPSVLKGPATRHRGPARPPVPDCTFCRDIGLIDDPTMQDGRVEPGLLICPVCRSSTGRAGGGLRRQPTVAEIATVE